MRRVIWAEPVGNALSSITEAKTTTSNLWQLGSQPTVIKLFIVSDPLLKEKMEYGLLPCFPASRCGRARLATDQRSIKNSTAQ
jgi:hypothetical protein